MRLSFCDVRSRNGLFDPVGLDAKPIAPLGFVEPYRNQGAAMKQLLSVACLLLFASSAFAREIPAEWPEWLQEAMKREETTKKTSDFSIADDRISGVRVISM